MYKIYNQKTLKFKLSKMKFNSNQKIDPRIEKTKKKIESCLFELLKTNKFQNISISEIINKSDVSRQSFYNHFGTKEKILESAFYRHFKKVLSQIKITENIISSTKVVHKIFEEFQPLKEQLKPLYTAGLEPFIMKNFEVFYDYYLLEFVGVKTQDEKEKKFLMILGQLIVGGFNSIFSKWVLGEINYSLEDLSKAIISFCVGGFENMRNDQLLS